MTDQLNMPAQLRRFSKKNSSKKRPKSLKKKVLHPLLITISVINAVMLIFFNLVFLLMLYSGVINDLKSISVMIEQVISSETADISDNSLISLYKQELDRYAISYHANMVLLDNDGQIENSAVDFMPYEQDYINESLIETYNKNDIGKTFILTTDDDILVVKPINVPGRDDSVFIYASMRSLWSTIKWGNQALLVIICFSVLAFVIAANIISHNIQKPIKELSDSMEVVGDGNFSEIEISESSLEMQNLTTSINEMLARLQAYHDVHTRSLQNLSHDLKTPLMSISGFAEGIKYGVFDNTDEATDVIIKESRRLTEVVEKMLILSDLDSLHMQINMLSVDINSFINEEAKIIEGYAMQNNVKVICTYEHENMHVLADMQLLATIVKNLLSNAIRYAYSEVRVNAYETNTGICISVADDGQGLSDEDIKNLFVRYYVGQTGHTGLGLSAAKSAAEYMGCRITGKNRNVLPKDDLCYNTSGAVFSVYFPKYE